MINKTSKTVKCNNCNKQMPLSSELKNWSTRLHIEKLAIVSKHFCPTCSKSFGFYTNGISVFK